MKRKGACPRRIFPTDNTGKQSYASMHSIREILPCAEVKIQATFLQEGRLPPFRGPTLRGGLGHHLRKTVCHIRSGTCEDCIVRSDCVYSYVFEGVAPVDRAIMRLYPYVPQPFVFIVPFDQQAEVNERDVFDFGIRLFGRAVEHFPYIAYALMELGKHGLGKDRVKFEIETIAQKGSEAAVYEKGNNRLSTLHRYHVADHPLTLDGDELTVHFVTPMRLRVGGAEARRISFSDLVRSILRRLQILTHFYGVPLSERVDTSRLAGESEKVRTKQDLTSWFGFQRYSGRQDRRMDFGGLVGTMTFTGNVKCFEEIFDLAQIVNVGKATSFGFGRIQVL